MGVMSEPYTYHITVRRAGVSWWRRLLRRHWRVEIVKKSQVLRSGNPFDLSEDMFHDGERIRAGTYNIADMRLYEPVRTVHGDNIDSEIIVIEEAEIYGNER